jgi:hypothetical protein
MASPLVFVLLLLAMLGPRLVLSHGFYDPARVKQLSWRPR